MKTRFYLTILMISFIHILIAQNKTPEPKKFLIGGSAGFSYSETSASGSTSKLFSAQLSPFAGYCVYPKMYAGVTLTGIYSNQSTDDADYIQEQLGINAGPFFRYYFTSSLFCHIQGNIGYVDITEPLLFASQNNITMQWMKIEYSAMKYGLDLGVGYDIKLSDHVYLEPMIRYSLTKSDSKEFDQISTQNQFIFNLGIIAML